MANLFTPLPSNPSLSSAEAPPALDTVETLFFYAANGTAAPLLFQVNRLDGSLTAVTEPVDLFPTALGGLWTAQPTVAPWLLEPEGSLAPAASLGPGFAVSPDLEPGAEETSTPIFTLVQGHNGDDFLIGPAEDAALFCLEGADLILVGEGNNLAFGGRGNDIMLGGPGDNIFFGGPGNDVLEGGTGSDTLFGDSDDDTLYGGAGANVLIGGAGADLFRLGKPGAYAIPLVEEPEPLATDPSLETQANGPDIIVDFSLADGDIIDLSLIAAQPLFAGRELRPFLSFVQVGADTHLQVITPLGQVSTEAILLAVQADTITAASLTFTPPDGLPLLK
jgi:hypothetical protein